MPKKNNGFCLQYKVEKLEGKGLGIFTEEPVEKGAVVWRHSPGAFEVFDEHLFRAKIARMPAAGVVYELTHMHAFGEFPDCVIRALDDGVLINHSNEPNLATNKTVVARLSLDPESPDYLQQVMQALADDRYSLIATRDIDAGEELVNDYRADDDGPPFYDALYEAYGVCEDFLDDGS